MGCGGWKGKKNLICLKWKFTLELWVAHGLDCVQVPLLKPRDTEGGLGIRKLEFVSPGL